MNGDVLQMFAEPARQPKVLSVEVIVKTADGKTTVMEFPRDHNRVTVDTALERDVEDRDMFGGLVPVRVFERQVATLTVRAENRFGGDGVLFRVITGPADGGVGP